MLLSHDRLGRLLLLLDGRCRNLQIEGDLLADEHSAGLQRDVPDEPKVLTVQLGRGAEPGAGRAEGILGDVVVEMTGGEMTDGVDDLVMRAWRGFLRAHGLVMRALDTELSAERRLGLNSYEVLLVLAWAPGRALRMSELADRVLLSRSGTTRLVDGLVARGLVERRRCPSDARSYLAVLTDEGLGRLKEAAPVHLRAYRNISPAA